MNAKKAKALRKAVSVLEDALPPIPGESMKRYKDFHGEWVYYHVTKSVFYPEGSRRRVYQDAKKERF